MEPPSESNQSGSSDSSELESLRAHVGALEQQRAEALAQIQDLEKKLDEVTRLCRGVCWELGASSSCLNSIRGWSKLLQTKNVGQPGTEEALKKIERYGEALNTLIQSIYDLNSLVFGRVRLNLTPTSLVSIIEATVTEINSKSTIHKSDVRLEVVSNSSVSDILADTTWLQKAFFQLLITCIGFSIYTSEKTVKIFVDSFESNARVLIKDIVTSKDYYNPEDIFAVFPFAKEDIMLLHSFSTPGGELAITRLIIELHGGKVSAERQPSDEQITFNQQTTFTILLPLAG